MLGLCRLNLWILLHSNEPQYYAGFSPRAIAHRGVVKREPLISIVEELKIMNYFCCEIEV